MLNFESGTWTPLTEAHRILGVDLSAIPGVSGGVLCTLISELGSAKHIRQKFRSAHAFASWMGLCPDNRISGGRILKAKTRKVANRVANILRMAAQAVSRADGKMGDYVRRFKGRLGKAEGIVAGAHNRAKRDSLCEAQPEGGRRQQVGANHLGSHRERAAV
jgi:transposase